MLSDGTSETMAFTWSLNDSNRIAVEVSGTDETGATFTFTATIHRIGGDPAQQVKVLVLGKENGTLDDLSVESWIRN